MRQAGIASGTTIASMKERAMKKLRLKGMENLANCRERLNRCIQTVDGLETANVDMATGQITYTKGCVDENLLREALAKENLEVEEVE